MSRMYLVLLALFGVILLISSQTSPQAQEADDPSPFAVFVDDYFDAYFSANPSQGTAAGLHQFDDWLEDRSAEATGKRMEISGGKGE